MAVALCQGGSGFPFFAPCIFQYFQGTPVQDITVTIDEIADYEIKCFCEKVCHSFPYTHSPQAVTAVNHTPPFCRFEIQVR